MTNLLDRRSNAEKMRVTTGLPGLDEHVGGGWETNELVILSAPAGHGKSTMAYQMASNQLDAGLRVGIVDLDCTGDAQLFTRRRAGHPDIRLPAYMGPDSNSAERIEAFLGARSDQEDWKLDVLYIDSFDRMVPQFDVARPFPSFYIRGLRRLARKLDICVVATTQTQRTGGIPLCLVETADCWLDWKVEEISKEETPVDLNLRKCRNATRTTIEAQFDLAKRRITA